MAANSTMRDAMRITTITSRGEMCHYTVLRGCTVDTLGMMIHSRQGISLQHQRLIYGGKELERSRTLWAYGITDGAAVLLMMKFAAKPQGRMVRRY